MGKEAVFMGIANLRFYWGGAKVNLASRVGGGGAKSRPLPPSFCYTFDMEENILKGPHPLPIGENVEQFVRRQSELENLFILKTENTLKWPKFATNLNKFRGFFWRGGGGGVWQWPPSHLQAYRLGLSST